ncbi:MAG TPA: type I methionyl aminopeptidase [Acidimicrobiales bacterium]|nr:type I methionyl aminopeptidase [Acidimicrobiales bacterium]
MRQAQDLKANDPCWCGSGRKFKRCHKSERLRPGRVSPMRTVPDHIERPPYAATGEVIRRPEPLVKSPGVIERMRIAGRVAAEVLDEVGAAVRVGSTTDELDLIAHDAYVRRDAYPSTLNYHGYPKTICTSVNEVICHGIPDDRALVDGDIVNVDVTAYIGGVHGDCNATFLVGHVDDASRRLVDVTRECLDRAIAEVRPGAPLNAIGKAIQDHAEGHGYGVVRAFVGHGIGEQFHTDLHVAHYYDPDLTMPLQAGMTFTIEPMITIGDHRYRVWNDGWTAVTADGTRTAQFEHTLLVTPDGAEILTLA